MFPATSPAQTVSTSPAITTRASATPSVTSPSATPSATVSPVAASSDANAAQPTVRVAYLGGTLNVSFAAVGPQTTPEACTFNSITCG